MFSLIRSTYNDDYGTFCDSIVCVSRSKETLEMKMKICIFKDKYEKEIKEKLEAHGSKYRAACPYPTYISSPKKKKFPAGIAQKDITPKMLAERQAWKDETERINTINKELMDEWYKLYNESCNNFLLYECGIILKEDRDRYMGYFYTPETEYRIG